MEERPGAIESVGNPPQTNQLRSLGIGFSIGWVSLTVLALFIGHIAGIILAGQVWPGTDNLQESVDNLRTSIGGLEKFSSHFDLQLRLLSFDIVVLTTIGLLLGMGQWLMLRSWTSKLSWWTALTIIGFLVGGLLGSIQTIFFFLIVGILIVISPMGLSRENAIPNMLIPGEALAGLVTGGCFGAAQALALKRLIPNPLRWIFISAVGWSVFETSRMVIFVIDYTNDLPSGQMAGYSILAVTLTSIVFGIATLMVLKHLQRQTIISAPEQTTQAPPQSTLEAS